MTWRLLYVKSQCEARYQAQLAERHLSSYVPRETVWRGSGPARKPALKPLLPGYVFADLTDAELSVAVHLPDALYFIRSGDGPAAIPEAFVTSLRNDERGGKFDATRKGVKEAKLRGKPLPIGAEFTVIRGAFTGNTGHIAEPLNRRSARVTLDLFGQDVTVTMDFADLQAIVEDEAQAA